MVAPSSVKNITLQSVDTLYDATGAGKLKLALGGKDAGLSALVAWQAVASHLAGEAFDPTDGLVVLGGVDAVDGETIRPVLVDPYGRVLSVTVPSSGVVTDRSGTITAGGTAQTLAAVNLSRRYLLVQNLHASEDLWVNFTTAAVVDQPSVRVAAGAAFLMDGAFVSTELVSVIAATTGHKFAAKEA